VGFRAFTQREARQRNLAGWVKNLPDGRVEAVIEGPKAQVDALLEKMRRGPRAARVDKLETAAQEPQGDLQGFEIRY
jgi:acylphosphatase